MSCPFQKQKRRKNLISPSFYNDTKVESGPERAHRLSYLSTRDISEEYEVQF